MRRVIEQEIEDKLADEILTNKIENGAKVTIDEKNGELKVIVSQLKTH